MDKVTRTVLIIDDDLDVRAAVADLIRDEFPSALVVECGDGAIGLMELGRRRFDVLVTDLRMPVVDGNALLQGLRQVPETDRPKKVIVLSATEPQEELLKDAPWVKFVPKPFRGDLLLSLVREVPEIRLRDIPKQARTEVVVADAIVRATGEVVFKLANLTATRNRVFIRPEKDKCGEVYGHIPITGSHYRASMAIHFDEPAFVAFVQGMLGETISGLTPEYVDACAELCNQVFGLVKVRLNEKGHAIQMALPTVGITREKPLRHCAAGPCIATSFAMGAGQLTVESVVELNVNDAPSS